MEEGGRRRVPLREFARLEGVTERTVRNWIRRGWLDYWRRPTGRYFIEGWKRGLSSSRRDEGESLDRYHNALRSEDRGDKPVNNARRTELAGVKIQENSANCTKMTQEGGKEIGRPGAEGRGEASGPPQKKPGCLEGII